MKGAAQHGLSPGEHRISPTPDSRQTHDNGLLLSYRHLQLGVTIRSAPDPLMALAAYSNMSQLRIVHHKE